MSSRAAQGIPFERLCRASGIPAPSPEFKFAMHLGRRWRFDWAWPEPRVALEIDGGVFLPGGGRHTRGAGYRRDAEKLNEAAIAGWVVLHVLPEQLSTHALDLVRRALDYRRTHGV